MKYRAGERRKAIEYEKAIAKWWKEDKTFEKSIEERPIDKSYVFYDGPPLATPVSKAEVTMDNDAYQKVTDPSAYVKFKLKAGEFEDITLGGHSEATAEKQGASPVTTGVGDAPREKTISKSYFLLAWTTTPWTLPANLCLAVNPDLDYGVSEKILIPYYQVILFLPKMVPALFILPQLTVKMTMP